MNNSTLEFLIENRVINKANWYCYIEYTTERGTVGLYANDDTWMDKQLLYMFIVCGGDYLHQQYTRAAIKIALWDLKAITVFANAEQSYIDMFRIQELGDGLSIL